MPMIDRMTDKITIPFICNIFLISVSSDVVDHKLEMAKQLGADYTINTRNLSEEQVVNKIQELLGEQPSISFDCSGIEQAVRIAVTVSTIFLLYCLKE